MLNFYKEVIVTIFFMETTTYALMVPPVEHHDQTIKY